ncbi:OmpA family protein [Cognatiyoonia sp. IB215446]|uniref:OmpA family protein n=1 Tax=Cognatiyoonia sp. IB215446 TaxID=3097355 RepID=UPI002A12C969|nr:OmpA family protein [Cognatiyoonia sp. IB215446]MDX8347390.1 OmpA family protein [Cognatiyoonia sp. IB215446]
MVIINKLPIIVLLLLCGTVQAQQRISFDSGSAYAGELLIGAEIADGVIIFDKLPNVEEKIERILSAVGTSNNLFESYSGTVESAAAILAGPRKFIIYNQDFFDRLAEKCDPEFAILGVLAHEIGHHFHDHQLRAEDVYIEELEADRFSGVYLARLGATIDQAKCALENFGSVDSTTSHPARQERLAALSSGYNFATNQTLGQPISSVDVAVEGFEVNADELTDVPNLDVKQLQRDLALLGYGVGEIDGVVGPRTRAQVEQFQINNLLDPALGQIDHTTLAVLGALRLAKQNEVSATSTDRASLADSHTPTLQELDSTEGVMLTPAPRPSSDQGAKPSRRTDTVYFMVDSSSLQASAYLTIEEFVSDLRASPTEQILIAGHADEQGTLAYNSSLSARRSNTVAEAMIALGVPRNRITIQYFGKTAPVEVCFDEACYSKNRRVTMSVENGDQQSSGSSSTIPFDVRLVSE